MLDICLKGEDKERYGRFKIAHRDPGKVVGDEREGRECAGEKCMTNGRLHRG